MVFDPKSPPKGVWGWTVAAGAVLVGLVWFTPNAQSTWERGKALLGQYDPPEVVSVAPDPAEKGPFIVAIKNPSFEDVLITGVRYRVTLLDYTGAEAAASTEDGANASDVEILTAETVRDDVRPDCTQDEVRKQFAYPVRVRSKGEGAIRLGLEPIQGTASPWCVVAFRLETSHGHTNSETLAFALGKVVEPRGVIRP